MRQNSHVRMGILRALIVSLTEELQKRIDRLDKHKVGLAACGCALDTGSGFSSEGFNKTRSRWLMLAPCGEGRCTSRKQQFESGDEGTAHCSSNSNFSSIFSAVGYHHCGSVFFLCEGGGWRGWESCFPDAGSGDSPKHVAAPLSSVLHISCSPEGNACCSSFLGMRCCRKTDKLHIVCADMAWLEHARTHVSHTGAHQTVVFEPWLAIAGSGAWCLGCKAPTTRPVD